MKSAPVSVCLLAVLRRMLLCGMAAGLWSGCGEPSDSDSKVTGPSCAPDETVLDDGRCQPPGLPLDIPPCGPGATLNSDGTCQKAGVPPDACGEGFEPDGYDGCAAILPSNPCPKGLIAVPGMTECQ